MCVENECISQSLENPSENLQSVTLLTASDHAVGDPNNLLARIHAFACTGSVCVFVTQRPCMYELSVHAIAPRLTWRRSVSVTVGEAEERRRLKNSSGSLSPESVMLFN